MKVQGRIPANKEPFLNTDGTVRMIEIELEIIDPEMIHKIEIGMIKDISLDPKPAQKKIEEEQ